MDGPDIFNFTINKIPEVILRVLEINGLEKFDIDFFVPHQANKFLVNSIRQVLEIPEEKFYVNLENGNTVSSTIPIALKELSVLQKKYKNAENTKLVLLCGFGVGLSWGATILKYEL